MSVVALPVPFGRVVTALVTPYAPDGSVDLALAARLADHLVSRGSDGLVLCGTTGESPTLSWEEQHRLFAAVREAVGARAFLLAGTGSNCTAEAVEATAQAVEQGAHGALVVVPYYNRPPQEGLEAHFRAIATAAPELPMMLYNIPGRTGCSLQPETTARLLDLANVISYKAASGTTEEVSQLRSLCGDRLAVYSGDDALTLPMLAVGAVGVVSVASHLADRRSRRWCAPSWRATTPPPSRCISACCRCSRPSSAPPARSPSRPPWNSKAGRWVPPDFPSSPPITTCVNASARSSPPCVPPDAKACAPSFPAFLLFSSLFPLT